MEPKALLPLDVPEIHARKAGIEWYERESYHTGQEANRVWHTFVCLERGWEYCLQHSISIDMPAELAAYLQLINEHKAEYQRLQVKQAFYTKTAEALQEALTLFLMEHYPDIVPGDWELDMEAQQFVYCGDEKEAA